MAINNKEERKQVSGIQVTLIVGVTNNFRKDVEWRRQAGWGWRTVVEGALKIAALFGGRRRKKISESEKREKIFQSKSRMKIFERI